MKPGYIEPNPNEPWLRLGEKFKVRVTRDFFSLMKEGASKMLNPWTQRAPTRFPISIEGHLELAVYVAAEVPGVGMRPVRVALSFDAAHAAKFERIVNGASVSIELDKDEFVMWCTNSQDFVRVPLTVAK